MLSRRLTDLADWAESRKSGVGDLGALIDSYNGIRATLAQFEKKLPGLPSLPYIEWTPWSVFNVRGIKRRIASLAHPLGQTLLAAADTGETAASDDSETDASSKESRSSPGRGGAHYNKTKYAAEWQESSRGCDFDCFICHASEDKGRFVDGLAHDLQEAGCNVWYDEFVLKVGDSLRRKIDEGLLRSKHGVVVLSRAFFKKEWPQRELDGLAAMAKDRGILPIWLDVTKESIIGFSPTLADIVAARAEDGPNVVVQQLLDAMGKLPAEPAGVPGIANGVHTRHGSPPVSSFASVSDAVTELEAWEWNSRARLETLANDLMTRTNSTPYVHGTWSVAYLIDGQFDRPNPAALLAILRKVKGRESGWPPWVVLDSPGKRPYPKDGLVECWLPTVSPGDFWRASPSGKLYLLRFYQEDAGMVEKPKTVIDLTVPVWRVGECLLHASRFAAALGNPDARVHVQFRWTGLSGRTLQAIDEPGRSPGEQCRSVEDVIVSRTSMRASEIVPKLPELVQSLAEPLYQAFDFFSPSPRMYVEMLTGMGWRGESGDSK
jgi:hypothetical protein